MYKKSKNAAGIPILAALSLLIFSVGYTSAPSSSSVSMSVNKCNSFMIGKDAMLDGSVITTQTAGCVRIWLIPAATHAHGDSRVVKCWNEYDKNRKEKAPPVRSGPTLEIPEVEHTYAHVMGDWWPLMNEKQVSIGETTLGDCRKELSPSKNSDAKLRLTDVTKVAVERASTAREAIEIIGSLMEKYGWNAWLPEVGEFLSIADKNEVWAFELVPAGPNWKKNSGEPGAAWCAMRIPDDKFAISANESIIGEINLTDKDNFMASSNVKSLAIKNGWWDPKEGKPFRWDLAYWGKKANKIRVWRALSLVAPSQNLKPDAEAYPNPIKPDKKLTILDIRKILEDQFEGTEFDRTKGLAAGPFGCPWWPMGTPNMRETIPDLTGPSIVINQSRNWLPDPIGGVMWVGIGGWGDTTVYVPFYAGVTRLPEAYTVGIETNFSWDSAFWIFNLVANWTRLDYTHMIKEIKKSQIALESRELNRQEAIDEEAYSLYEKNPSLAVEYLSNYCNDNANHVLDTWRELAYYLIAWYYDKSWVSSPIEAPDWWRKALLEKQQK